MGDSHLSMVGKTLEINAVNSVSIRGGAYPEYPEVFGGERVVKREVASFGLGASTCALEVECSAHPISSRRSRQLDIQVSK